MAANFAVPPPQEGNPHHGRHYLRPSDGADAPRNHGPPRPVALSGQPALGAYGGLQPGRNERATLAVATMRSPGHPCSHAKAQHLGHPWIPVIPGARLRPPATTVPRGPGAPQAGGTPYLSRTPPGATSRDGSLSGTYRSPLKLFAPQRDQGSSHTSGVQGGTPKRHQETRNPGRSRRRSRTPPPAARPVVFKEDMARGHGGPHDHNAKRTSYATDP